MGLVEEEHELRQLHVTHLGQGGVQLRQQPQEEGTVELGLHHQLIGSQHTHDTLAVLGLHQVVDIKRGFSEEHVGTLILQLQQGTLDGTYRGGGDMTVFRGVVLGVLRHIVEHRTEIFQVEDLQATLIGDAEDDVQHTILRLVQA